MTEKDKDMMDRPKERRARNKTDEEWNKYKPEIIARYNDHSTGGTIQEICDSFGEEFKVSPSQLSRKIKEWPEIQRRRGGYNKGKPRPEATSSEATVGRQTSDANVLRRTGAVGKRPHALASSTCSLDNPSNPAVASPVTEASVLSRPSIPRPSAQDMKGPIAAAESAPLTSTPIPPEDEEIALTEDSTTYPPDGPSGTFSNGYGGLSHTAPTSVTHPQPYASSSKSSGTGDFTDVPMYSGLNASESVVDLTGDTVGVGDQFSDITMADPPPDLEFLESTAIIQSSPRSWPMLPRMDSSEHLSVVLVNTQHLIPVDTIEFRIQTPEPLPRDCLGPVMERFMAE